MGSLGWNLAKLGVVIPCYNEAEWVHRSLAQLESAAAEASWNLEVIVVDDGGTPECARLLDEMENQGKIRVIHQTNQGRFAARVAGLRACSADLVFLLDSRVFVNGSSLKYLKEQLSEGKFTAWNAHVDMDVKGSVWTAFWSAITRVGWRAYLANPRPVTFGPEDFDRFPKGTTAFFAPRQLLLEASEQFHSLFDNQRLVSDDTKLLRDVASKISITIDPNFSVTYFGRDSAKKWLKQCYYRGTTFVDGYVRSKRRAAMILPLVSGLLVAALGLLVLAPLWFLGLAVGVIGMGLALVVACKGSWAESRAFALLIIPFTAVFSAGFLRGLLLALRPKHS